jgi:xylan 1,4-beta-xylosidase
VSKPGNSETFQWVHRLRGDTMLMSLTDHKYLGTKPNTPGQVLANLTGPTPARKGGECFKLQVVE